MAKARTIGSRLRDLREEWSLTQHEFAAKFGLSTRTAQSYERDEAAPSAAFLLKLAEQNIDLNELLTGHPHRVGAGSDSANFTTIVTVKDKSAPQPGELDIEVLEVVLRSAIDEAKQAKNLDWQRTAQRFAAMYARQFGAMRGR